MNRLEALSSVLAKDEALIAGVDAQAWAMPTPCPDYDVRSLVNHIIGWLRVFEASVRGGGVGDDPEAFTSAEPVADFQAASTGALDGWRTGGTDRTVAMRGSDLPGELVLSMMLIEYVTHGCDLALGSGQAMPFSEAELALVLEVANEALPDQYRGAGKPFGARVEVPESAPVLAQLLGFMGRSLPSQNH